MKKRYTNNHNKVAFPLGGIGSGMFLIKSNGVLAGFSLQHKPNLHSYPVIFGAVNVKENAKGNTLRLLTGPQDQEDLYREESFCIGAPDSYAGLPWFEKAIFTTSFPFAKVALHHKDYPIQARLLAWSPFTPPDEKLSSLPFAAVEYELTNKSEREVEGVFYFNAFNLFNLDGKVRRYKNGFVLETKEETNKTSKEAHLAVFAMEKDVKVNVAFFRGGWYDSRTMLVKDMLACFHEDKEYADGTDNSRGGSISVAFRLKPKQSRRVKICFAWYVPHSSLRCGLPPVQESVDIDKDYYTPYYCSQFSKVEDVCDYIYKNYTELKKKSLAFAKALQATTLPDIFKEAIEANLCTLKSPTILRQKDGKLWAWEGVGNADGSCYGTCTHVWNYAQSLSHLFPSLERGLRESEYLYSLDENGHQLFRTPLPIQEGIHDFHSAADGQLGGIIKLYREFTVSGDVSFLRSLYPYAKRSLDYCIKMWDPDLQGALFEPHHNTYDIEFWGADAMCTGFYLGALKAFVKMSEILGEECIFYKDLAQKVKNFLETELFNGEYFIQSDPLKGVKAEMPKLGTITLSDKISLDALELFKKEGPKYQYGKGCLSDALIGIWLAEFCGINTGLDKEKILSHLNAVYKYNLRNDFSEHINPQRPGYMFKNEGGLLLCTWPNGGQPSIPFIYSNEVWTGIEYQVASHLVSLGETQKGIDIVEKVRGRYNGHNRNPYGEIECGHWYARAMASYALMEAYSGVRYDAYKKILYYKPTNQKVVTLLAGENGYALVTVIKNDVQVKNIEGLFDIERCVAVNNY